MLIAYSFLIFLPMFLENYVSRSELWGNGKMTICSFDTPIFNAENGTLYI